MLDVAVVIVSWNVRDYLAGCLRSVYAELGRAGIRGDVWVVDNGSTDGTQSLLNDLFPQTHLVQNKQNAGFGAANNQGMALAGQQGARTFLLLNPDTIVRPGAIAHLLAALDGRQDAGMVGARLVYGDGRFQHSAFAFPGLAQLALDLWPLSWRVYDSRLNGRYPRRLYQADQAPFPVDFILGAAMLVRRDVAEATRGFDEGFHMYCEEVDWCWRIREAGWLILTVPQAEIVHFGGESTRQVPAQSVVDLWRSRARLYQKHHKRLTLGLARRLAGWGLRHKAMTAETPALQRAYEYAAGIWAGGAG